MLHKMNVKYHSKFGTIYTDDSNPDYVIKSSYDQQGTQSPVAYSTIYNEHLAYSEIGPHDGLCKTQYSEDGVLRIESMQCDVFDFVYDYGKLDIESVKYYSM